MPNWKVDIQALQLAVSTVQAYRRITAKQVAEEVGVPPSSLSRLKAGERLDIDAFVSLVAWLGADVQRFVTQADGSPLGGMEPKAQVDHRDVLIAWSWAREALASLPAHLLPGPRQRAAITEALQRLHDEVGSWGPEELQGEGPSEGWGALYCGARGASGDVSR